MFSNGNASTERTHIVKSKSYFHPFMQFSNETTFVEENIFDFKRIYMIFIWNIISTIKVITRIQFDV